MLKPVEGLWSMIKGGLVNFAATDMDHLITIVKRLLKRIQYQPRVIQGYPTGTGLIMEPP